MKYYIQRHASGYCGNCLLFWRKGGHGYTCDLNDAEVWDESDPHFQSVAADTAKYTAWEKDYLDHASKHMVDHQDLNFDLKGVWK